MKKLSVLFLLILVSSMLLSACGSKPEQFPVRGEKIDGTVTVVSRDRIEFEGRLEGDPDASFWLFSQEEGVGEGSPNWTLMNCKVGTFDTNGNANTSCFAEVDKKHRQNAIVLSTTSDPQSGKQERIEYRPNLVIGEERFAEMDHRLAQFDVKPTDVKNTLSIYYTFDFEMDINADYNRYPPTPNNSTFEERYPASRGFYLTFISKISCDGVYSENHVDLYHWNGNEWKVAQSIRLEDVDFQNKSGTRDFNIEGFTVRLSYDQDIECFYEYEYVEIP